MPQHPNVVAFYGFSSSDAALYLVMEYVPISFEAFVLGKVGQSLSTRQPSSVGPCQRSSVGPRQSLSVSSLRSGEARALRPEGRARGERDEGESFERTVHPPTLALRVSMSEWPSPAPHFVLTRLASCVAVSLGTSLVRVRSSCTCA
jgi:hypothetical protein